MSKAKVVQFEVTGRDVNRLQGFYGDLFGWHLQQTPGGQTAEYRRTNEEETGIPGAVGPTRSGPNLAREDGWDGGSGHLTVYVEVEDIEEAVLAAEKLGGRVITPVHEVSNRGLKLAFIADPEDHVVGLSQGLQDALRQSGFTR